MTTYAEFFAYFLAEYTKLGFADAEEAAAADAALAVSFL